MPAQDYIRIFGPEHILYIALLVAATVLLISQRRHIPARRRALSAIILVVSIFQQILLYSAYFYLLDFHLGESLPFHVSRICSILGIILLIKRNRQVFVVLSFWGIYAWATFIYPSRVYDIFHPIGLSFILNHTITILLPYYMMIAYDLRIRRRDYRKALLYFTLYLIFVYFFNPLVDGNYFYLKYRPFFSSWPDYIYLPAVLLVTSLGFYLGEKWYIYIQDRLRRGDDPRLSD